MKTKTKASPFDGLLGLRQPRLPISGQVTVVVAGKPVHDSSKIVGHLAGDGPANDACAAEDRDDLVAEARRLQQQTIKAKRKAADQRYRAKTGQERSREWALANPERMAKYRRQWRERNAARVVKDAHEYFKKRYYSDVEAARAKNREYYARNRDRILQRQKERKAELAARQAAGGNGGQS